MVIPGGAEWIIIGGVVLVLFGARAIPKFARSIGRAKQEFEKGIKDGSQSDKNITEDEDIQRSELESKEEKD